MHSKPLTSSLSVSSQPCEADLAQAAAEGFRAIIDNRPDGEEPGQLTSAEVQALAAAHGMAFAYMPVVLSKIGDQDVARMADALARLEKPVLAYCRTGTRSATLWALTQTGTLSADEIVEIAAGAGYDLEALRGQLASAVAGSQGVSLHLGDAGIVGAS